MLRLTALGVACACMLAAGGCASSEGTRAQDPQTLTIRQVKLVDDQGRVRMVLDAQGEKGPSLVFLNAQAKPMLELACANQDGPRVVIRDDAGRPRFELGLDTSSGVCTVAALGDANNGRVEMVADSDGQVAVRATVPGSGTAMLGGKPSSSVGLVVAQADGSPRVNLGALEGGNAFLTLNDVEGRQRVSAFSSENGPSGIGVIDGAARARVQFGIDPANDQSFLQVSSESGGSHFQVSMQKDGTGSAGLRCTETKSEVLLHCVHGKEPTLSVISEARERLRISVDAAGDPALWVRDADGSVKWKAPK